MEPRPNDERLKRRVRAFWGAAFVLGVVIVWAILTSPDSKSGQSASAQPNGTQLNSESAPAIEAPLTAGAISSSAKGVPQHTFESTGRLPTSISGFSLGMSSAQAIAIEPKLAGDGAEKSGHISLNALPAGSGINLRLDFQDDQLVDVWAFLDHVSGEDAALFVRDTMQQLGEPSRKVYSGPDAISWIWIDKDVRFMLDRSGDPGRPQNVNLTLANYPMLLSSKTDPTLEKRAWGDDNRPAILKDVDREVGGLDLGMQPWQARTVLKGIDLHSPVVRDAEGNWKESEHITEGDWKDSSSQMGVQFYDGHLMAIYRQFSILPDQQPSLQEKLVGRNGTPATIAKNGDALDIEWADSQTSLSYLFLLSEGQVNVWLRDRKLSAMPGASKPVKVEPFNGKHSFF